MITLNITILSQILSFLFLMWVLHTILYKPILEFLDKRKSMIADSLNEAKAARKEAQMLRESSNEELKQKRLEAHSIYDKLTTEAKEEANRIREEAKQVAEKEIARGKIEINKMIEEAKIDLQKQVSALAIQIAEQVLSREINPADHHNIIRKHIDSWQPEVKAN